jgi:hypothetical protein
VPDELLDEPPLEELLEPLPDEPLPDELPVPVSVEVSHPGWALAIARPATLMTTADKATLFMCVSQFHQLLAAPEAAQARLVCASEPTSQCAYRINFRRVVRHVCSTRAISRASGMTFVSRSVRVSARS